LTIDCFTIETIFVLQYVREQFMSCSLITSMMWKTLYYQKRYQLEIDINIHITSPLGSTITVESISMCQTNDWVWLVINSKLNTLIITITKPNIYSLVYYLMTLLLFYFDKYLKQHWWSSLNMLKTVVNCLSHCCQLISITIIDILKTPTIRVTIQVCFD
jgi:hypothetical protein